MKNAFENLNPRLKLIIMVSSIFLITFSVGLLIMGDSIGASELSADLLKHSKEQLYYLGGH